MKKIIQFFASLTAVLSVSSCVSVSGDGNTVNVNGGGGGMPYGGGRPPMMGGGGGGRIAMPPSHLVQRMLRSAPPSSRCRSHIANGCRIYTEIRSGRQVGWMPAPGYNLPGRGGLPPSYGGRPPQGPPPGYGGQPSRPTPPDHMGRNDPRSRYYNGRYIQDSGGYNPNSGRMNYSSGGRTIPVADFGAYNGNNPNISYASGGGPSVRVGRFGP